MQNFLDFEKPLLEIRTKIEELRHLKDDSKNIANELSSLQDKYDNGCLQVSKVCNSPFVVYYFWNVPKQFQLDFQL